MFGRKVRNVFVKVFFIFLASRISLAQSQNYFKPASADDILLCYDKEFVKPKVDSLLKDGVSEVVIFQTDKSFEYLKSNDSILTFICWQTEGINEVQIVSSGIIYSPISFDGNEIFSFNKKQQTFATWDEKKQLMMIPPVTTANAVFYFNSSMRGYFELPDRKNTAPLTYMSDPLREKTRKDWFEIIYDQLYKAHFNFKVLNNYDRYAVPPMTK